MEIHPIDPRDVSYEIWNPVFRVYFWHQRDSALRAAANQGIGPESVGYTSDEYEIQDGDVHEVIAWANDTAAREGKTYTLYVVVGPENDKGLARLAGEDPTRTPG